MIVTLNDIDVVFLYIGNEYINSDIYEKVYFIYGKEFFPEGDG